MRTTLGLALCVTLCACSGSSSNDGGGGSSQGGGAGGSSGGTGGGSSGSGGAAAGAGGSMAGSGGTSTGGSSTGGSSTGGSSTGGTGTGGSGTGGSGTGGTGTGGTGGATSTANCQPLCDAIIAAACSNGPTMSSCLLTCKALTSSPKCDPTANAYFACAKQSGIKCNANGDAYAQGCGLEWLKAIDCATTENPNPAIVTPCVNYCNKVTAANCPGNGTNTECNSNCKWAGATGTGCDDEWLSYINCGAGVTMTCFLGFAVAPGCGTQWTAYSKCINAAGK